MTTWEEKREEVEAEIAELRANADDLAATMLFEDAKVGIALVDVARTKLGEQYEAMLDLDRFQQRVLRSRPRDYLSSQVTALDESLKAAAEKFWSAAVDEMAHLMYPDNRAIGDEWEQMRDRAEERLVERRLCEPPRDRRPVWVDGDGS